MNIDSSLEKISVRARVVTAGVAAAIAVFSPELDRFVTRIVPFGHVAGAECCETSNRRTPYLMNSVGVIT